MSLKIFVSEKNLFVAAHLTHPSDEKCRMSSRFQSSRPFKALHSDLFEPGQSALGLAVIHHKGTKAKLNNFDLKVAALDFFSAKLVCTK
jgi:hypothetical protein